jgi:hypothetical protein
MTQLLSLLNQVFDKQAKSNNLEQHINRHNPNSHQQVEELTRHYLYHYFTLKGL